MQGYPLESLEIFFEICKIPHASFKTELLKEWIIKEAKKYGALVNCDNVGNIHCVKGTPKLCLQGHYDMVYVSKNSEFSVIPEWIEKEEKTYLCAKDSSLGADNGIAVASMLVALKNCKNIECLFTNDEEVGMIGANHIALQLQAPFMLNCDSEDIDEVVCGCAGGYDLECKIMCATSPVPNDCVFFSLQTQGFIGGHSGIEIHKNIPNAILVLAKIVESLVQAGALVMRLEGGEKRNAIPVSAKCEIAIPKSALKACKEILENATSHCNIEEIPARDCIYFDIAPLLQVLFSLKNGVIASENGMPILSSNLGILRQETKGDNVEMCCIAMGRGNREVLMQEHLNNERAKLEKLGVMVEVLDFYAPWEREENTFVKEVLAIYKKYRGNPYLKSIHAGLECGILKQKFPNISFVSIGPTISHPHSVRECLDMESLVSFDGILREILTQFDAF